MAGYGSAQGYLTCASTGVREAAVHCTVRLLVPFVMLLGNVDADAVLRAELLHVVHSTLHDLLVVGVADPGASWWLRRSLRAERSVRACVFECVIESGDSLDRHVAQADMLPLLFDSLSDQVTNERRGVDQ